MNDIQYQYTIYIIWVWISPALIAPTARSLYYFFRCLFCKSLDSLTETSNGCPSHEHMDVNKQTNKQKSINTLQMVLYLYYK